MKFLLITFTVCLSFVALSQPFKSDAYGHVNSEAFKTFCKQRNYSLIGTFDSLPGKKGMAAQVIKNGTGIYVDLNGKEFTDHDALAKYYGFYSRPMEYYDNDDDISDYQPEPIEMKGYPVTGKFIKAGRMGYKIRDKVIVQPKYDYVEQLSSIDNYLFFRVRQGSFFGICDYQGKELIPAIYDEIEYLNNHAQCFFTATKDSKKTILSRGGIITVPPEYDEIIYTRAGKDFVLFTEKNGMIGVLSSSGKTILNAEYKWLQLAENSALNGFIAQRDGKYGFINSSGILKVPIEYSGISCQDGYILTYTFDKNVGVMDTNGTKILEPIYSGIEKPKSGNCFLVTINENGIRKSGITDLNGKVIEEPRYGAYKAYGLNYEDNELYLFAKETMYEKTGLFNVKTLNWVLPCQYKVRIAAKDYLIVTKEDSTKTGGQLSGVVDRTGTFSFPCIYNDLNYNEIENNATVLYNGKYGLVDPNNKIILPFHYEKLTPLAFSESVLSEKKRIPKGYLIFTENDLKGVMTTSGKITVPAAYEGIEVTALGLICVSGSTFSIFSFEGKLQKTVDRVVSYRAEGFITWKEESGVKGIDHYGNESGVPAKPVVRQPWENPPPTPPMREKVPVQDGNKVYNSGEVEEPASYPGGNAEIAKFLMTNLRYPASAMEQGIEGKCYLQFIVETDGSLSEITIKKKVTDCRECDAEAIRVVKLMPKWNPAKLKGSAVRSMFYLPVTFKLQ